MTPFDLLKTRATIVGLPLALTMGAVAGMAMQIGPQDAEPLAFTEVQGSQYAEAAPMAWPSGKVPDYVIGSDFLHRPQDEAPVVLTSADLSDLGLVEPASYEPADQDIVSASGATTAVMDQPAVPTEPADAPRASYASTSGDILDTRLPEEVAGSPKTAPTEVAASSY